MGFGQSSLFREIFPRFPVFGSDRVPNSNLCFTLLWFLKCHFKQKSLLCRLQCRTHSHKKTVVSFLVVLKMPFFNENIYYTACDSGGIQIKKHCGFLSCGFENALFNRNVYCTTYNAGRIHIKKFAVSFPMVLKMPSSIEIFIT